MVLPENDGVQPEPRIIRTPRMNSTLINRILLVLACGGLFVAGYLSMAHWMGANVACGIGDGCDTIANSQYARIPFNLEKKGIPVAVFGMLAYVVLVAVTLTRSIKGDPSGKLTGFGTLFSGIGFLLSMALMFVSFGIIHATCTWCVASAVIMTAIFLLHLALRAKGELQPHFNAAFTGVIGIATVGAMLFLGAKLDPNVPPMPGPIEKMIPENAHRFGDPTSPLVIVEFVDLTCGHCKETYEEFKRLLTQGAKFDIVVRHFPLVGVQGHELALPAAGISEVVAEQGKFTQFLDMVYGTAPQDLTVDKLLAYASQLGVDPDVARKRIVDKSDPAFKKLQADIKEANRLGIQQTPALYVGIRGGDLIYPARKDGFQRIMYRPDIQRIWDPKMPK